jgi:hypothetical protein
LKTIRSETLARLTEACLLPETVCRHENLHQFLGIELQISRYGAVTAWGSHFLTWEPGPNPARVTLGTGLQSRQEMPREKDEDAWPQAC